MEIGNGTKQVERNLWALVPILQYDVLFELTELARTAVSLIKLDAALTSSSKNLSYPKI